MELSELERNLVEAAVEQRVAFLALDQVPCKQLDEQHWQYLERRDPAQRRWRAALIAQWKAADLVIGGRAGRETGFGNGAGI